MKYGILAFIIATIVAPTISFAQQENSRNSSTQAVRSVMESVGALGKPEEHPAPNLFSASKASQSPQPSKNPPANPNTLTLFSTERK